MDVWISWLSMWAAADPLTVTVEGLRSNQGQVYCALYATAETWLGDDSQVGRARSAPSEGRATCSFGDVGAGSYAVAFFHDLNHNGRMDYDPLGLPREPWGVSRDAPAILGPPRWLQAVFRHPGRPQRMKAR